MGVLNVIRNIFIKLGQRIETRRRLSHFKCGDCETFEQCGQLPSEDCIARVAQIERNGDNSRSQLPPGYHGLH